MHRSGYLPGELISTHCRRRFRIVNKNPAAPGPPPDNSLWLVHYGPADPQNRYPVNRISMIPDMHRIRAERQYLESQGQLLRKPFMLHDRLNWPQINFNGALTGMPSQVGAAYPNPMQQMARNAQYYPQAQGGVVGPPPAKRPRQVPPSQLPGSGPAGVQPTAGMAHDPFLEDEENHALGDLLDHLTPRDISTMRYTQHHEWMEEILSSPYAAGQIAPVDLGLGLMGELSHLTDGLFDAPNAEPMRDVSKPNAPDQCVQTINKHQLEEFEKRVSAFMAAEQAEIEKMKTEHAKKMADLKRSIKTYMQAEKRLRDAVWESSETRHQPGKETVDEVVQYVEKTLGVTTAPRKDVVCVEKGGLVENDPDQVDLNGNGNAPADLFFENGAANGILGDGTMDADSLLLEQYTTHSMGSTPAANLVPPHLSNTGSQDQSAGATPSAISTAPAQGAQTQSHSGLGAEVQQDVAGMPSMDDMDFDVDVDMTGLTNDVVDGKAGDGDWVVVEQSGESQAVGADSSGVQQTTNTDTNTNTSAAAAGGQDASVLSNDASAPMPPDDANAGGLFGGADFGAFDTLDSAGDALAEYTSAGDDLGLDLDNEAFGDFGAGEEQGGAQDGGVA